MASGSSPTSASPAFEPPQMICMEVWGGNQPVDGGVVMAGLDAWVYARPFEDAPTGGGDVYYVSSCATGRITRLLIADVAGHGAVVCDVAGVLRQLMRRYVNQLDQTQFVASMNTQLVTMAKSECFATAIVTTFFAPTNDLTICNAGHPPPLLYRAATREWSYLEEPRPAPTRGAAAAPGAVADDTDTPGNIPLGVMDLTGYEQFGVRLRVGDLVLCYTDSLIESPLLAGDGYQQLGRDGLLDVLRSLDVTDASTLIARLMTRLTGCADCSRDDVTVLLFRPNGLARRVPIREQLRATLRALRMLPSVLTGREPAPLPDLSLANVGGALIPLLQRTWGRGYRR